MKSLKIHQNGVGGWVGQWGGGLGEILIKEKPKKVQLMVFLSKTGTYRSLLLGTQE